ncbi:MAG: sulfurtransferase [Verrucomicrobia bacterium]|nr:sulfurtransferase [Verrucomicrobiota bacterium]
MTEQTAAYAHPDALVSTEWLAEHLDEPNMRIVESNEDILLYDSGHISGAVQIDWREDLQDELVRDYIAPEGFAALCARHGIGPETTVIFYGDKSNWWACYALWAFRLFGHEKVKILDGGRDKWVKEGRGLTKEKPAFSAVNYPVPAKRYDDAIRAFYEDALKQSAESRPLIDVRSPGEFIPRAKSVPWKTAVKEDGTFKTAGELREIYVVGCALRPDEEIIAYCRIGERSSHTWFVLTYLLGYEKVRNYDGSWTEWGNKVRAPIERS